MTTGNFGKKVARGKHGNVCARASPGGQRSACARASRRDGEGWAYMLVNGNVLNSEHSKSFRMLFTSRRLSSVVWADSSTAPRGIRRETKPRDRAAAFFTTPGRLLLAKFVRRSSERTFTRCLLLRSRRIRESLACSAAILPGSSRANGVAALVASGACVRWEWRKMPS